MQLTPRYGSDPVITLDGPPAAIAAPTIRQRRRLAAALGLFTDQQWAHPSRCEGWSNRDVLVHLDSTNVFWTTSIKAGLQGAPTTFLSTVDPVASPAQLVAASADVSVATVLERFIVSTEVLTDLLASLDGDAWSTPAESPPGHVSISALAHHALWDSWVHERDVLLPLGIQPDEQADEIAAGLRYVAALGPALALNSGHAGTATLVIEATDPDVSIVVRIGDRVSVGDGDAVADLRLTGSAVELVEALSIRAPLARAIPVESAWMLGGLNTAFGNSAFDATQG